MTTRIWSDPSPRNLAGRANGIAQVIFHLDRLLPERGFEYVRDFNAADLVVRHAGAKSGNPNITDVAHCHGLMPTAMKGRHTDRWEWNVNNEVIQNLMTAKVITVPSQWVADIIRRDMRVEPEIVPWGIDPKEWKPGHNKGYVLWAKGRAHGVNDPTPVMQLSQKAYDRSFVVTFGNEGPNVRVTGLIPFEQMRTIISEAGVYLATTRETFGIQTLEAMACGVPVLGFRWAATPDIVFHKETGYLAEPGNIDDLYEGLMYCQQHRRRLGDAARELALTYTWEAVADAMATIYDRALDAKQHVGPEVSIIIPCYNYGEYVSQAITSALEQQGCTHEVIVVNDHSNDNSRQVIDSFGKHITAIHNEYNFGVAEARNKGASVAKGKYLVFLDADDYLEPGWLISTITAMKANDRVGIAYTRIQLKTPSETRLSNWPPGQPDIQNLLRGHNTVPTCCLVRREAFDRAGGYKARFTPAEDGELWLRIAECGYDIVCASQKPQFTYRVGHASLSRGKTLPDHRAWHMPSVIGAPPFPAVSPIAGGSYAVRDYDRPVVSVVIQHDETKNTQDLVDTLDMLLGQTFRFWEVLIQGNGPFPNMRSYPFVRKLVDDILEEQLHGPLVFVIESGDNIFNARTLELGLGVWQKTGKAGTLIPLEWLKGIGLRSRTEIYAKLREQGLLGKEF